MKLYREEIWSEKGPKEDIIRANKVPQQIKSIWSKTLSMQMYFLSLAFKLYDYSVTSIIRKPLLKYLIVLVCKYLDKIVFTMMYK